VEKEENGDDNNEGDDRGEAAASAAVVGRGDRGRGDRGRGKRGRGNRDFETCPLIDRIGAISAKLGSIDESAIGTALFDELHGDTSLSQAEKEKMAISYAKSVVRMVNGFSDYRDEFGCIDPFLAGCIQTMSLDVIKACVDAGKIMYSTQEVDVYFREGWARAVIRRCSALLSDVGTHQEQMDSVGQICNCLKAVGDAGFEYSDMLQADSELRAAIDAALSSLESTPDSGAMTKSRGNPKVTAIKALQGIKAIVISGQEKMELLEKSIDLSSKKYKQWGNALLDAQNMSCTDSPDDLAMQVRASTGPLTTAALQILQDCTEAKGAAALLNAGCWIAHILEPWLKHPPNSEAAAAAAQLREESLASSWMRDEPQPVRVVISMEEYEEHRRLKHLIASNLKASGCIELLFKQLEFWAIEWNGMYGDCGGPIFRSLYYMMENFPEEVKSDLVSRPAVLTMVRKVAESRRYNFEMYRYTGHFEDEGLVCIRMERFVDGISSEVTDTSGDKEPSRAS
jgi:hypothetical protein